MTNEEKLQIVKIRLDIPLTDTSHDSELLVYLNFAKCEILNWMYINKYGGVPAGMTTIPPRYDMVQVEAVLVGFNQKGAEGERVHNENGINRTFKHSDMIAYIHDNVYQLI